MIFIRKKLVTFPFVGMARVLQRGNGGIRMVREDGYVSPLELNEPSWIDDTVRYFASQAQHIYIIYTITPSTLLLLLLLFFGGEENNMPTIDHEWFVVQLESK